MKQILLFFSFLFPFALIAQTQTVDFNINPTSFDEDEEITITVSNVDPTAWDNVTDPDNLYLWAWYYDSNGDQVSTYTGNGDWDNSNESHKLTNNGDGTYSYTLTPTTFFGDTGISQLGILVKAKDGTGDQKSQDFLYYVGKVTLIITAPTSNPTVVASGGDLTISAYMQSGGSQVVGSFEVFFNNVSVASGSGYPTYGTTLTNITEAGTVRIEGSPFSSSDIGENSFEVSLEPTVTTEEMPAGLEDGINYNESDPTKATLVIDAPNKDFIYVAGSFNNWTESSSYLMKKNTTGTKFWLELTGLTSGEIYTYQYWVYALNPVADSPQLVKTADPYSTLVLSPFDDPWISENTFPDLTTTYAYPDGQEREVTVLQTNQSDYNWQVTDFTGPTEEDLIVYEILIRDFDADRNFQDLIDKIDYFKNLNVNAIELMPIMEFEGNESWGYNTSFHLALDKFYGTPDKFKELVDTFHQNDIAVILDVALNHAFGRNPMVRMWMDDPDADGWGDPSSENPYFNEVATHSYSVGSDFNHQSAYTQYYVERVVKHWIEEYNIDGFRWDLTKGFTQDCTSGDDSCTNSYQQDRVDILKQYADYSWSIDPDHYVIFEHLGTNAEEQEWANYRLDEGKGVMMWGKMTSEYNELSMGYTSDISGMGYENRGFTGKRLMGYAESHDEERLMYKNLQYGNTTNSSHNVTELNTALSRMSAIGAVSLTIPGPKMIWHFGELGMENSIYTCSDGSVNTEDDAIDGNCKLDTKPQPQWDNDWLSDTNRSQIYNDWARINELKISEDVFEGSYSINSGNLTPKIYIWDDAIASTELKNVVVLANFDVTSQDVTPNFPYTGTWYDLMDETGATSINVTNTTNPITIAAGQFKIYGNQTSTLSVDDIILDKNFIKLYPNPTANSFRLTKSTELVEVFDVMGKLIKSFNGDFTENDSFNISELSKAIYFVKIYTAEGIGVKRIIKN
ncbi:alpha-amylase family glycosyl hydrolase [Lutibacter sp. TH_r2]|uniref:alpha-amylase family glycosyl hydrolase n=1 Tax=Lutibacter sp. TH_r2 TaxID=3082083 RepID=UPI002954D2BB|nr:alpha-amylase family glycosyl hydrolase [Lutibacter sp. TH_r2]MDV7188553.1 alpha-amylase family glycosyl hydrolase [Lutibacter sp. TH_r2]